MQNYLSTKYSEFYMKVAEEAAKNSVAKRMQVGACIVLPTGVMALGWNGTASGQPNHCEHDTVTAGDRLGVGKTLPTVIHAEINALKKLLLSQNTPKGAVLFTTLSPCLTCAVQLVDLGISEVVYRDTYKDVEGIKFLKNAGISVRALQRL